MADPWVVTPGERIKHDEQFKTLRPIGGYITGEQAKGFFLQSRLPPPVLGIIWALSDVDGDGKMDLHEFSIACKLINLKLRGFTLPPTLPASLKQSACVGVAASQAPVASVGPSDGTEVPASPGGAVLVGVAGLTGCSNGVSLTSARSPGPIVSTVVVSTSVPTSAAPISAPNSVAPVSAPADLSQVSSLITPTSAEVSVTPAQSLAAVIPNYPSSILMTVSGPIPTMPIGPHMMPETSLGTMSGILPVSAAPYVILGVSAGAGQEPVTAAVPTAVLPASDAAEAPAGAATAAPLGGGVMPSRPPARPMPAVVPGGVPLAGMAPVVPTQPILSMAPAATSAAAGQILPLTAVPKVVGTMPQVPLMSSTTQPMVPPASQPLLPLSQPIVPPLAPLVPSSQPLVPPVSQPMVAPVAPMIPPLSQPLVAPVAPMVPPVSQPMVPPSSQPMVAAAAHCVMGATPQPAQVGGMVGGVSTAGGVAAPGAPVTAAVPPGAPGAPAGAAVQRTGSQDSGGAQTPGEWAVPQASKLKFTQVFNMSDRTKSGFLSGVQARNILIQSHLPQQLLAQIWALSDVDNDGRLSCEEFVLAMYLCESAKAGNKLPTVLPADLIPPTNRRQRASSIHSGGSGGTPVAELMGGINDNSFEDKRRENFEKGQAELERRRKALLDAQRRETEERLRREREEESKREKARLEAERRRQEELEREMQRQREIETQREQERKRQEEMREQARKDAEFQRQQEWEKQRLQELMNVRQRQQENMLSLKAKNQSLSIEFTTKEDRVKELTQKISETRQGVTEVKATIDTMRSTRDTYMTDMNQLKAAAREQNQRLLVLNQEKARLKARSTAAAGASGAEQAAVDASFTSKQMVIKQLQEKVDSIQAELSSKEEDVNNNLTDLTHMKEDIHTTAERCAELYLQYSEKRKQVMALREKLLNPDAAWGDAASSSWAGKGFDSGGAGAWTSAWPPSQPKDAWPSSRGDVSDALTSSQQFQQEQEEQQVQKQQVEEEQVQPQEVQQQEVQQQQQQPPPVPPPPVHQPAAEQQQPPVRPPPPSTTTTSSTMPLMANTGTVHEKPAVPPAPQKADGISKTNSTLITNNTSAVGWGVHNSTTSSSSTTTTTTAPWGAFSTTTTTTIPSTTSTTLSDKEENAVSGQGEGVMRRRALYQFDARNTDEISFMPGDVIVVTMTEGVEPGWLGGELRGQTGWFPEAYTELLESREAEAVSESLVRTHLENIPEEAVTNAAVQQKAMGEAVGVFPWRAKQRNHLSFNKGDRITVREKQDQWWFGELNNVGGWFPRSFVRMVSGPAAVTSPVTTPQEAPEEPPMPDNLVHDDVSEFYQALYPYQSGEPGDLIFNAGDVILVVKKEGDWWHGICNENSGIFPSNYVELMTNQFITSAGDKVEEQPEVTAASEEQVALGEKQAEADLQVVANEESNEEQGKATTTPATVQTPDSANLKVNQGSKGKKPEIASVLAPYDATSSNQLSLQRGQLVMIRKKTASGWWEGEVQAKGKKRQIGWFPATYVKIKGGSSRSTPVSMELTNREDAPPDQVSPTSANPLTQVTVTPPTDEPMKGPNDASNGFAEQVEALYPYTAMNEDELTFEAGAIISVIDKEDAAWWKGTIEGAIGVFPSNYVQPYPSDSANTAGTPDAEDSLCYRNHEKDGKKKVASRSSWHISMSSPVEQKRQIVIKEFLETEAVYLRELQLVDEVFIKAMRLSGIVSEKELDLLFVNWDELILSNSYFSKAVKVRCINSPGGVITMIGDVLCQQISQLKPYLRFCSLQMHGATLLGEKCQAGGPWADLVRQCQEHPLIQGHTLTSFLLKPMQRITRYPLLIKQLLKYTPEGHPDYYNTQEALAASETLCAQVNEAVSQRDNTDKLEWMQKCVTCEGLQERLVFNSLTNTLGPRKLLHTGILHKAKSKRELVAFLLSDFLLLTTPNKSVASCTTLAMLERALTSTTCTMYRKPMFLTDLRVEGDKDSEMCFTLVSPACGDIAVSAPTTHERNNWLKKIAIAQKHIIDTERSLLHRQQSKEKDMNIMGRVLVTVMAGVSLSERHVDGTLQSFCEVSLGSQVHRTSIATSPHPKWDSTMQFLVKSLSEDVLCITVYEKGYFKPNEFLGRTEIKIHQVYEETRHQPGAQPQVHKLALQEAKTGEVILKISLQLFERS
ncbi:intersectin-1-like isoform X6 [Eriocheir sinensis]|uniref:intersectin-1-like isoform X6 n=1 Tax=Eriocheir sinensis TaxID=95602 RepID=UPI0021C7928C|nr:intersectin-1-like isoform X6 [Eriocheir sinensis]